MNYLFLPAVLLKFWFIESPVALFKFFASFNTAFFELFSLPLLLRTYTQPLKNEYRQGLVGFSRAIGIFIKTFLILIDVVLLVIIYSLEIFILVSFVMFPIATVALLFY